MAARLQARLRARLMAARDVLQAALGPERAALSAIQADAAVSLGVAVNADLTVEQVASLRSLIHAVPFEARDSQRVLWSILQEETAAPATVTGAGAPTPIGVGAPTQIAAGAEILGLGAPMVLATTKKTRRSMQCYVPAVMAYFLGEEWDLLLGPNVAQSLKVELIFTRLSQLGAVNLDEPSLKMLAAILLALNFGTGAMAVPSDSRAGLQEDVKRMWRSWKKRYHAAGCYLSMLPAMPASFRADHRDVFEQMFKGGMPEVCRISMTLVQAIDRTMVCRGFAGPCRFMVPAATPNLMSPMDNRGARVQSLRDLMPGRAPDHQPLQTHPSPLALAHSAELPLPPLPPPAVPPASLAEPHVQASAGPQTVLALPQASASSTTLACFATSTPMVTRGASKVTLAWPPASAEESQETPTDDLAQQEPGAASTAPLVEGVGMPTPVAGTPAPVASATQQEQADPRADGPPLAAQLLDDFLVMEGSRKAAAKKPQLAGNTKDTTAVPAPADRAQPTGNRKRIISKQRVRGDGGAQDVQPENGKKQRKGGAGAEEVSARRHSVPSDEKAQHGHTKKDAVPDDEKHCQTIEGAKGVSARRHSVPDEARVHITVFCRLDDESSRNKYRVRWGKQSKGFKYQPRNKKSKKAAYQNAKHFMESIRDA